MDIYFSKSSIPKWNNQNMILVNQWMCFFKFFIKGDFNLGGLTNTQK
jgi:hypothetical protein